MTSIRLLLAATFSLIAATAPLQAQMGDSDTSAAWSPSTFHKPADSILKQRLTPTQYAVTQHDATEPPYHNAYWDHHAAGIYVDVVSGEPLFSSLDKYDSHTGWPSFTQPIEPNVVVTRNDHSLAESRTEVRSRYADSHLGHVFDDGPLPTGLRYCMNSAALRFVPVGHMAAQGYGAYLSRFKNAPSRHQSSTRGSAVDRPH